MELLTVKRQGSPNVISFPVGSMAENVLDVLLEAPEDVLTTLQTPEMRLAFKERVSGIIAAHIQDAIKLGHQQAPPSFQQQVPEPSFNFE